MNLRLASENLLQKEIEKFENDSKLMEENRMFYQMCKRELVVMRKLKVDVNMTGTIEELEERIGGQHIYFMKPEEYEEMKKKSKAYDKILDYAMSLEPRRTENEPK